YRVDTRDASCMPERSYMPPEALKYVGMGFSTNAAGSSQETLFVAGHNSGVLGIIAFPSLTLTSIATVPDSPELTGTNDAKLWGFFPRTSAPYIAQIDKTSGVLSNNVDLPQLAGMPQSYAFAFWGGDFWIFYMRMSDPSTAVYHVKTSDRS